MPTLSIIIRSFLFQILYLFPTAVFCIVSLFCHILPKSALVFVARTWLRAVFFLLKYVQGLSYKIEGLENLPKGPYIVASKHQSAFETCVYPLLFDHPIIILKKELRYIPFWGWLLWKYDAIMIDRSKPKEAMKTILTAAEKEKAGACRPLLIFPEGTRTRPGAEVKYQNGIAVMYDALKIPVAPIAVNTGIFWGKRGFFRKPGVATIKILPPILPGLSKKDFMIHLHNAIETESFKLLENLK